MKLVLPPLPPKTVSAVGLGESKEADDNANDEADVAAAGLPDGNRRVALLAAPAGRFRRLLREVMEQEEGQDDTRRDGDP